MTDIQVNSVKGLIGQTVKYKDEKFRVLRTKEVNLNLVVTTDKRTMVFTQSEISDFLEDYEIIEPEGTRSFMPNLGHKKAGSNAPAVNGHKRTSLEFYEPTESQKQVQNALLEMLKKVQDDPNAIPQAKAVCDIANTMVNIEKSQIQLINIAKRGD